VPLERVVVVFSTLEIQVITEPENDLLLIDVWSVTVTLSAHQKDFDGRGSGHFGFRRTMIDEANQTVSFLLMREVCSELIVGLSSTR
jgi:hypothetical protein